MSSLQEIESAITALSPEDRVKLVHDLPSLLPECEGDLAWQRIVRDPRPSPILSRLADAVDAQFSANPEAFPQIQDSEFERHS